MKASTPTACEEQKPAGIGLWECEGQEYPVFNSEVVIPGSFLPLLSLVSMATTARQKHPSLAGSNTDEFNRGQKQPLLSGKQEKVLSSFLFLFRFFFLFAALGRGLTYHTCFSSENSRDKCVLFSGVSPDSPIGHIACRSGCL